MEMNHLNLNGRLNPRTGKAANPAAAVYDARLFHPSIRIKGYSQR